MVHGRANRTAPSALVANKHLRRLALALALAAPKVCQVAPGCTQLRFCLDGHGWVLSRRVCAEPPSTATAAG